MKIAWAIWLTLVPGCVSVQERQPSAAPRRDDADLAVAMNREQARDSERQREALRQRSAELDRARQAHETDCATDRAVRLHPSPPIVAPAPAIDDPKIETLRSYIRAKCTKHVAQVTEVQPDPESEDGTTTMVGRITIDLWDCPKAGPDGARGQVLWPMPPRAGDLRVARVIKVVPEDLAVTEHRRQRNVVCADVDP